MKNSIYISSATSSILGLSKAKVNFEMKTLYVMIGNECSGKCSFCTKSKLSTQNKNMLSRVVWPKIDYNELLPAIIKSYENNKIFQVCLQVTKDRENRVMIEKFLNDLKEYNLKINLSYYPNDLEEIVHFFELGINNLGISTDYANKLEFSKYKTIDFDSHINLIIDAAKLYKNRITTHLIVGLNETDRELIELMNMFRQNGVIIGLFAFTPVKGTFLQDKKQPSFQRYRAIQLIRYLIYNRNFDISVIEYDSDDMLKKINYNFDKSDKKLKYAFLTSGCKGCTRPYYNDRIRKKLYNYFDINLVNIDECFEDIKNIL